MSTRSAVGIINEDDTVTSVYCHYDGYLIGVGDTLRRYYSSEESVRDLISYGNISTLCETIGDRHCFSNRPAGQTTFYSRDRGDADQGAKTYQSIREYEVLNDYADYYYLYNTHTSEWTYRKFSSEDYESVEQALKDEYNIKNTRIAA